MNIFPKLSILKLREQQLVQSKIYEAPDNTFHEYDQHRRLQIKKEMKTRRKKLKNDALENKT